VGGGPLFQGGGTRPRHPRKGGKNRLVTRTGRGFWGWWSTGRGGLFLFFFFFFSPQLLFNFFFFFVPPRRLKNFLQGGERRPGGFTPPGPPLFFPQTLPDLLRLAMVRLVGWAGQLLAPYVIWGRLGGMISYLLIFPGLLGAFFYGGGGKKKKFRGGGAGTGDPTRGGGRQKQGGPFHFFRSKNKPGWGELFGGSAFRPNYIDDSGGVFKPRFGWHPQNIRPGGSAKGRGNGERSPNHKKPNLTPANFRRLLMLMGGGGTVAGPGVGGPPR